MSPHEKLLSMFLLGSVVLFSPADARAATPGCSAAGAVPAALPSHMLFGWGQNYNETWAKDSGTRWDVQWMYLSGQAGNNWYNTWGGGTADGSFLDTVLSTVDSYGFITGIHLYNMGYGHDGGDSGLVTEIQNASWTKQYFTEFKVMMQRIKTFGKPVIVVLEGDSFGMVEMLVNNDPTAPAAVASTGLPELASLPNTVAGFGLAFLAIRKSVGAYNAVLGPDTPYYAANGDIMNWPDTQPLQSHVDYQWKFFGALGVGPNATGDRFDFSASCPSAADCAAYSDGRPCWDPGDTASISSPSINRYLEWLHLYNQTSGVRWMLHQVPIGNSQHRNVAYDGTARSGYRDNKVEYLFQYEAPASATIRDRHLAQFANAGVLGVLFGFSDDGDTPWTDLWHDNQPFLKTHLAEVTRAGGFAIASGSPCGETDSGAGGSGVGGNPATGLGGSLSTGAGGKSATNTGGSSGVGGIPGGSGGGASATKGGGTGWGGAGGRAIAPADAGFGDGQGIAPTEAGAMTGVAGAAQQHPAGSLDASAAAWGVGGSQLAADAANGLGANTVGPSEAGATAIRPDAAKGCGCTVGARRWSSAGWMLGLVALVRCRRRRMPAGAPR